MESTFSTFLSFHPENAVEQIPHVLKACTQIEERDRGRTLVVRLSGDSLGYQDLGRLTIINGKCRNQGMKVLLQCPQTVAGQLSQCSLDRLIWIDDGEDSAS